MEENNLKSAVEALIFASEKPITLEQIKKVLADKDSLNIKEIIAELKNDYQAQNRGLRIVEIAGGFQMATCSDFAPFLKKLFKIIFNLFQSFYNPFKCNSYIRKVSNASAYY